MLDVDPNPNEEENEGGQFALGVLHDIGNELETGGMRIKLGAEEFIIFGLGGGIKFTVLGLLAIKSFIKLKLGARFMSGVPGM